MPDGGLLLVTRHTCMWRNMDSRPNTLVVFPALLPGVWGRRAISIVLGVLRFSLHTIPRFHELVYQKITKSTWPGDTGLSSQTLLRLRQEDHKLKVFLGHEVISGPFWSFLGNFCLQISLDFIHR